MTGQKNNLLTVIHQMIMKTETFFGYIFLDKYINYRIYAIPARKDFEVKLLLYNNNNNNK